MIATLELDLPLLQSAFRGWFGLTDTEAEILAGLFAADRAMGKGRIAELCGVRPSAVKAHVSRLRQAMTSEAIDFDGEGYRLSEIGVGECRGVLTRASDELRRASIGHRAIIGRPFD